MFLVENIRTKCRIDEKDKSKLPDKVLCRVTYPICNIGERNANNRVYESGVWERVLEEKDLKYKLENRALFGHAEHPEQTASDMQVASHVIHKMWIDESTKQVYQTLDIIDTPMGRIIDSFLRAGCQVGVSTRAEGDLEECEDDQGKFSKVIPEKYKYVTTDFTADPSTYGAIPIDVKRGIVSETKKELSGELKKDERQFAEAVLNSMKCKNEKCQGCGACEKGKVNEKEIVVIASPETGDVSVVGNVHSLSVSPDLLDTNQTVQVMIQTNPVPVIPEPVPAEPSEVSVDLEAEVEEPEEIESEVPEETEEDLELEDTEESKQVKEMSGQEVLMDAVEEYVRNNHEIDFHLIQKKFGKRAEEIVNQLVDLKRLDSHDEHGIRVLSLHVDYNASFESKINEIEAVRLSVEDVKKMFKHIDSAFANHLTGLTNSKAEVVKRGLEVGLELSDEGKEIVEESKINETEDKEYHCHKCGRAQTIERGKDEMKRTGKGDVLCCGEPMVLESKINETAEINKMYQAAGLPVPDGKGIHTEAFHKLAIEVAKGYVKGGDSPEEALKKAYPTAMKQLGKEKAVKKSHQSESTNEKMQTHVVEPNKDGSYYMARKGWTVDKLEDLKKLGTVEWPDHDSLKFIPKEGINIKITNTFESGGDSYWDIDIVESQDINSVLKDVTDLKIKEAVARAEKEAVVEAFDSNKDSALEIKMLTSRLRKALDEKNVSLTDVSALCSVLEKKAEQIKSLSNEITETNKIKDELVKVNAELIEAKNKIDIVKAENDAAVKVLKFNVDSANKTITEVKANCQQLVKEYIDLKLKSSRLMADTNTRALLESSTSLQQVDAKFDELLDVARVSALHSNEVREVIISKPMDSKTKQLSETMGSVFESMGYKIN